MKSRKRIGPKGAAWRGRAIIIVLIFLLAGSGAAWYYFRRPGLAQAQPGAAAEPRAYTTAVKRGNLRISAAGSGSLVAYQSVDLSFSTSGMVTELNVKTGDIVKAGQVLASLGSSDTLEANLAAAELQVLQAQKALSDLQKNADLSLAQAYADLLSAQDAFDTALVKNQKIGAARCGQDVIKRYTAALEGAAQKLDAVHAETANSDAYIAAKKAYDTALANYNYCASYTADEKAASQSSLDVSRTSLQAAQDHFNALKAAFGIDPEELAMNDARLKEAQAGLTRARDQLSGITLTSPIDGKVTYLAASNGALVGTTKFITIADISHATVEISVDESDIDKLVLDAPVTVTFDALPDQPFTGRVVQINPQMATSGQYRVAKGLVELDPSAVKSTAALPFGLSASVTIVNQEVRDVLLVPVVALRDLGDGTFGVMVQGSDGQLKLHIVTVGIQDSDYAEITSGLKEDDRISTGAVEFIAAGPSTSSDSLKNAQGAGRPPGDLPGGGIPPAP